MSLFIIFIGQIKHNEMKSLLALEMTPSHPMLTFHAEAILVFQIYVLVIKLKPLFFIKSRNV
jgi:hypothetical protein